MATILCVDDQPPVLDIIRRVLDRSGHRMVGVHNVAAALNVLARDQVDLIIADYRMPETNGLEFIARLASDGVDIPVIMVTGYGSIEHAVSSIKAGAVDYLTKPVRPAQLDLAVEQALEFARLRKENDRLRREVKELRGEREIVGDSEALQKVLETVAQVAPTRSTVLVQGESGTGKELVARAIHGRSDRSEGPFVSVNCAALPENLIESTLFGHEKGAFTGATRQVRGAFERAHLGTLLLDEVSEMRIDLQAKLLRVLQEQEFERVGGTAPVRVDVRVVATTNRDIVEDVRAGRFREDLYYRLSVVPVRVPPLRERLEDVPLLAHRFATITAAQTGKKISGLSPEAIERLQAYTWPGNVRELAHAVERAVVLSRGPVLGPDDFHLDAGLAPSGAAPAGDGSAPANGTGQGVVVPGVNLDEAEKVLIQRALDATDQNRTRAAELLGISVRTLRNKLNRPDED